MPEALEHAEKGVVVNGKVVNNLSYATNTVLIAGSIENPQTILNRVVASCKNLGLSLNAQKIKYMAINKQQSPIIVLRPNNVP